MELSKALREGRLFYFLEGSRPCAPARRDAGLPKLSVCIRGGLG